MEQTSAIDLHEEEAGGWHIVRNVEPDGKHSVFAYAQLRVCTMKYVDDDSHVLDMALKDAIRKADAVIQDIMGKAITDDGGKDA